MLSRAPLATWRSARRGQPAQRTRGFVLIEVLIAMLIFAIGTLGLVGLQASLTRAASSAKMRADAAYLAQDLIGTLWVDAANLASYENCTGYARCLAWHNKVVNTLPGASTSVTPCTATSATCTNDSRGYKPIGQVRIVITWTVPGEPEHRYETGTAVSP